MLPVTCWCYKQLNVSHGNVFYVSYDFLNLVIYDIIMSSLQHANTSRVELAEFVLFHSGCQA